jgi:hypothetical protein
MATEREQYPAYVATRTRLGTRDWLRSEAKRFGVTVSNLVRRWIEEKEEQAERRRAK